MQSANLTATDGGMTLAFVLPPSGVTVGKVPPVLPPSGVMVGEVLPVLPPSGVTVGGVPPGLGAYNAVKI